MNRSGKRNTFTILRDLERRANGRPKIGQSAVARDDIATLGQDPFTAFPAQDLLEVRQGPTGAPDLRVRFLGLFGPQGPLPLATTIEVETWVKDGDRAFVDFADIITTRFLQLFYRAWSDARPITQMDHATQDRFRDFIASLGGFGTPGTAYAGDISALMRQDLVPLLIGRVRSAGALEQALKHAVGGHIHVQEFVPMALQFEPEDRSRLGRRNSGLGRSIHLGSSVISVQSRICIHVKAASSDAYFDYLPGATAHRLIHDLVKSYIGDAMDAQIAISLPKDEIAPAQLGQSAYLGWLAPLPRTSAPDDTDISATQEVGRFALVAQAPASATSRPSRAA